MIELVSQPRETREQALERLVADHGQALRAFLRVRLGIDDDMDDIFQQVFIKLADLANLPNRLPPSCDSNRSFIIAVANNLIVDMERHRNVRRRYVEYYGELEDRVQTVTPEISALASEELHQVRTLIMNMNPKWRRAFILNRFKRKTYREIAGDMGVSVKQVEKYMKQALLLIREAAVKLQRAGEG